ncbi:hypothetical protein Pcinc_008942 [Petrolisthes cinctipes]|uniref:Uncharacterized protein n=1 Tax=Petrolisthes cinctipes TaxID=88211 RepID=A0AAE1G5L8_PETCI|nr:hypothetical protein Pcinc_008942 [Petrolisthes cinctipes]
MGNIQGLYPKSNQSKVPFLNELSIEEDPMFIALTETHLRLNNILDLFFTINQDSVSTCRVEKTIFSDHNLITINTAYRKNKLGRPVNNMQVSMPFTTYNLFSENIK